MKSIKALLAAAILWGALGASFVPAGAAETASSAVIFMYHRFGEDEYPSTNIRIEQFEAHIRELKSGPYTVLPVPEIVDALKAGRELPERTIGITIDDAYASTYRQAWPRLREAGLPFTLFVATEPVDQNHSNYMTWDQVRELAGAGVTIGHHTASHPHMPKADAAANQKELDEATRRYREELDQTPSLFAYPYGETSLAIMGQVRKAGLIAAFGQHSGVAGKGEDFFYLPRYSLNENYGAIDRFRLTANALPLAVTGVTPDDPLIGPEGGPGNPPAIGFTVTDKIEGLERMGCFLSHEGKAAVQILGGERVEIRAKTPFPKGRTRLNCTLPGPDGRWRWLGRQFYRPF